MAAYALGLPLRMHEAEHERAERAARACCGCEMLPLIRARLGGLGGGAPRIPCQPVPAKQNCPTCIQLQGMIAAGDAPIVLLETGKWVADAMIATASQRGQEVAGSAACRGPPGPA
jgi:hypothetical protein